MSLFWVDVGEFFGGWLGFQQIWGVTTFFLFGRFYGIFGGGMRQQECSCRVSYDWGFLLSIAVWGLLQHWKSNIGKYKDLWIPPRKRRWNVKEAADMSSLKGWKRGHGLEKKEQQTIQWLCYECGEPNKKTISGNNHGVILHHPKKPRNVQYTQFQTSETTILDGDFCNFGPINSMNNSQSHPRSIPWWFAPHQSVRKNQDLPILSNIH